MGRGCIPFILHLTAKVAGAPAGVNEFPFAIIDAYSIPGVVGVKFWHRLSGLQWCMSVAFAVS